jgi:phenylacetate-CoA ligase
MYWQAEYECINRVDLEQIQFERLQATLNRVARNVPFYRKRFEELGIDPYDLRSVEDIRKLPFTTKADIRDNYPYGLFAVPLRDVVRLQASSGAPGKPAMVGYTKGDLRRWSELVARVLTAGGVTKDDVVQVAFSYGMLTGGFGMHYGAELIGASVIPASSGNDKRQVMIMQDYRTTALVSTPSYALHLAGAIEELGIGRGSLHLKYGLFGGEPWSEAMRREIEERLGVKATDNYGVSEVMGPGIAGECLERAGLHINEDHFLAEVLDPETHEPVAPGRTGELVLTTLTREAFPVVRFRTGDLTRIIPEPCPCGRTLSRMSRVPGRCDDMLIIRGVNVFPSQVEAVLLDVEGIEPHYQIVIEREGSLDKATVLVGAPESLITDRIRESQQIIETIRKRLHSELGVGFMVRLVEGKSIERGEGAARRVVDKRTF